ncbi:MAG: response regulator transcription factor [Roseovarius sp.]|uniref:response regulator transcription factor n=1 Tax=Roseovarius sp. TaxID=1486281 RepID=UPI001B7220AA|nr:response regulator transcription factor [Roseovarius sp.]MBQ0750724.1 response regulator transcription factor [Roseovarius sp.]MBQ0811849.1 response regulator transcription factor [Roseovarius sp.]
MSHDSFAQSVVIADSHAIIREGIRARLESQSEISVVAEACDGYSALKACREFTPDIFLMDFTITRPSGRELLAKVRQSCPDTKIIVLCSEMKVSNAFFCFSKGAFAFMPKQASGSDFVNAVTAASRGFSYMPNDFVAEFLETRRNLTRSGNIFGLSPRELEIVDSCMQGKSTKDIAEACNISVRTVETHKNNIYRKTSCRSLDDLTAMFSPQAN